MKFEYDDNKSQTNKEKHGIDFVDAQNLWKDADAEKMREAEHLQVS